MYRQLQAGTYGCAVIKNYKWDVLPGYGALKGISFIHTIMLRTPILLHPLTNKRTGTFTEVPVNPMKESGVRQEEWLCYPAKVGSLLCYE